MGPLGFAQDHKQFLQLYSPNPDAISVTLNAFSIDTKETFNLCMEKCPERVSQYKDKNIKYILNEYGLRVPEKQTNYEESIMFLGCSQTFGVGINYEDTFSYKVTEQLSMNSINLGSPGRCPKACFRYASFWIDYFQPSIVIYCEPDVGRDEVIVDVGKDEPDYAIYAMSPHKKLDDPVYKNRPWLRDYYMVSLDTPLNAMFTSWQIRLAIAAIAKENDAKYVGDHVHRFFEPDGRDYARDGDHFGPRSHDTATQKILDRLRENCNLGLS